MHRKDRVRVINFLQERIGRWLEGIYEASNRWSRPVKGKKPYTLGVINYDRIRRQKYFGKKITMDVKKPDTIYIKNYGTDHFIIVRHRDRILTAVLCWNKSIQKYELYIAQDCLTETRGYTNKSNWLFLISRRVLINQLTQLALKIDNGYTKESDADDNICVTYLGLPTYYTLIGLTTPRYDVERGDVPYYSQRRWIGLNRAAWMKHVGSAAGRDWGEKRADKTNRQLKHEKRVRAAMTVLQHRRTQQ